MYFEHHSNILQKHQTGCWLKNRSYYRFLWHLKQGGLGVQPLVLISCGKIESFTLPNYNKNVSNKFCKDFMKNWVIKFFQAKHLFDIVNVQKFHIFSFFQIKNLMSLKSLQSKKFLKI